MLHPFSPSKKASSRKNGSVSAAGCHATTNAVGCRCLASAMSGSSFCGSITSLGVDGPVSADNRDVPATTTKATFFFLDGSRGVAGLVLYPAFCNSVTRGANSANSENEAEEVGAACDAVNSRLASASSSVPSP